MSDMSTVSYGMRYLFESPFGEPILGKSEKKDKTFFVTPFSEVNSKQIQFSIDNNETSLKIMHETIKDTISKKNIYEIFQERGLVRKITANGIELPYWRWTINELITMDTDCNMQRSFANDDDMFEAIKKLEKETKAAYKIKTQ